MLGHFWVLLINFVHSFTLLTTVSYENVKKAICLLLLFLWPFFILQFKTVGARYVYTDAIYEPFSLTFSINKIKKKKFLFPKRLFFSFKMPMSAQQEIMRVWL